MKLEGNEKYKAYVAACVSAEQGGEASSGAKDDVKE